MRKPLPKPADWEIAIAIALIFCCVGGNCNAGITYPKAPAGGQQIAYKNLFETGQQDVRALVDPADAGLQGVSVKKLTLGNAYQVYDADWSDLVLGRLLSAAQPWQWRYPIMYGTRAVGSEMLDTAGKSGKALEYVGTMGGPDDKITLALRKAARFPQIKKQDYEVRYLEVLSSLFFAVWLHGKSDDIIIPLPPGDESLKGILIAYHPYSESQIIKILKPGAEEFKNDIEYARKHHLPPPPE